MKLRATAVVATLLLLALISVAALAGRLGWISWETIRSLGQAGSIDRVCEWHPNGMRRASGWANGPIREGVWIEFSESGGVVEAASGWYEHGNRIRPLSEDERESLRFGYRTEDLLRLGEAIAGADGKSLRPPAALSELFRDPAVMRAFQFTQGEIVDPWGRAYVLTCIGSDHFIVASLGADGIKGGVGASADVSAEVVGGEVRINTP